MNYAEKLTKNPDKIKKSDFNKLKDIGLNDGEILEANQIICYFNYVNRSINGLGVSTNKSAATTKLGKKGVLHGSKTLLMQDENGQVTEPYSISAGLDYPGIGPLHAHLFDSNRGEYISVDDDEAMNAGIELSRLEGIIPAIETAHAFSVFDKLDMKGKVVVINLSGRGDKDLETYIKWGKY